MFSVAQQLSVFKSRGTARCEGDDSFDRNPPHHKNVSNEGGKTHQKHSRAVNLQAAETGIRAALQRQQQQIQLLLQEAERVSCYFSFSFLSERHAVLPMSLID